MSGKREIILLNISGADKPGLTSSITSILSQYNINILDIGQAVIHNNLGLGILFEVPTESSSSPVLKDILFKSYEIGIKVKFTPISIEEYNHWVDQQGREHFILTVLGEKLTAKQISVVTKAVYAQQLNIDFITRLTGRIRLDTSIPKKQNAVVQMSLSGKPDSIEMLRCELLNISRENSIDISFQRDNIYRRNRRLVCFDMDSTLIQTEVIDEIAEVAGKGDKVRKITEMAMKGEIDFIQSFEQRIRLLKGVNISQLKGIAESLPLTPGASRLFKALKKYGYKTAILSGGFTYFGKYLQSLLGIDYIFANELEIVNDELTGNYIGEIVDGKKKAELLRQLALKEDIHLEQVIAVGDGSNDLPMINAAGLGIAFHAKPIVKRNAQHAISTIGLDAILYLMGFRDRELDEII